MYWTEASPADFMIQRANLDGTNIELLVTGLVSPSGIALDVAAGKMYWTDIGTGKIQRANLDGSVVEDLLTIGAVFTPVDIALDVTGNKIYWTESTLADFMIQRADLDGSNVELLVSDLVNPSGIALDVDASKMYWTDLGTGKIQRANLDGSGVEDLVTTGVTEPVRIALDVQAGKIYWTEASPADFMIQRANLDGSNIELLITGLVSPSGIALTLQPGQSPAEVGQWSDPFAWPVIAIHAAMLPTGKLLHYAYPGGGPGSLAYTWDPATDTFQQVFVDQDLFCSGHALLADGSLYVTGGNDNVCQFQGRVVTHTFDSFTETWTQLDDMSVGRWYPTNVTLGDGRVVIFSGRNRHCENTPVVEMYTPGVGVEVIPEADRWALVKHIRSLMK